ncbi:MAG: nucleoside hydrolase [Anaerovoracaceae bacterium]
MKKIDIIIDTDPGIDDFFAILLGISNPKLNVIGITTTFGNRQLDRTNRNALLFLELINRQDIPVAKGSQVPLKKEPHCYMDEGEYLVHGAEGVGNAELFDFANKNVDLEAVDFIAETILKNDGNITLVPIGPLTNIARFLQKYPELHSRIDMISLMGGSLNSGNITSDAEFNIYLDPEAAKIVFDSGIKIVMSSLEGTREGYINRDEWEPLLLGQNKVKMWLRDTLDCYSKIYEKKNMGIVLHDSLAVSYLIDNEIGEKVKGSINVITDEKSYGKTVFTPKADGNVEVITKVNREKFLELFIESIKMQ